MNIKFRQKFIIVYILNKINCESVKFQLCISIFIFISFRRFYLLPFFVLDLSECQLMQIPDAVYHLMRHTELKTCDLSGNVITKIPAKFAVKFSLITGEWLAAQDNLVMPFISCKSYFCKICALTFSVRNIRSENCSLLNKTFVVRIVRRIKFES